MLLLLLIPSVVIGLEDFNLMSLEPKSGIYYERLGFLKFSSAIWKLIVPIDISDVQMGGTHTHTIEVMKNVTETLCQSSKNKRLCDAFENTKESLSKKAQAIDALIRKLELAFDRLPLSQNQSQSEESKKIPMLKNFRYFEDESEIENPTIFANVVSNYLATYLSDLEESCKTILKIIDSSKKGKISSSVITEDQLTKIKSKIGTDFDLPQNIEVILRLGSVLKAEKSKDAKNLILEIGIPLLEHETYDLYRLHPVPVLQNLTKQRRVLAHVVPRVPYAAFFENKSSKYSLLSQQDLENCHESLDDLRDSTWICRHEQPIFGHRSCESAMFHGPMTRDDLFLCDIRITRVQQSYWHHLPKVGGWLFLLPREIELEIICSSENRSQILKMKDTGVLKIRSGCYGKHKLTALMGTKELGTTMISEKLQPYLPEERLDFGEEIRQIGEDALWVVLDGKPFIEIDNELRKTCYCDIGDRNVVINTWWILMSLVTFLTGIKIVFFSNLCRTKPTKVDIRVGGELGPVINVDSIEEEL